MRVIKSPASEPSAHYLYSGSSALARGPWQGWCRRVRALLSPFSTPFPPTGQPLVSGVGVRIPLSTSEHLAPEISASWLRAQHLLDLSCHGSQVIRTASAASPWPLPAPTPQDTISGQHWGCWVGPALCCLRGRWCFPRPSGFLSSPPHIQYRECL